MDKLNEHQFDFSLPMYPNQTIGDKGMQCEMTMDGRKLEGVTSLFLKAGADGFTNVAIEFEASCAVQFVGHLDASIVQHNGLDGELLLADIYNDALEDVQSRHDPDEFHDGYEQKAEFVLKVITLAMERFRPS